MVKSFLKRIQKTVVEAYDPGREERVKALAAELFRGLKTQRQKFSLEEQIARFDVTNSDVRNAARLAFRQLLRNIWKDGVVSEKEKETVQWVVRALKLSDQDAVAMQREFAVEQFRTSLAHAMDDGTLSDDEYRHLEHISSVVGSTAPTIAKQFFESEGEGFLRAIFLSATESGELAREEWQRLVKTSIRFGFSESELNRLIQSPAKQFVEHVLADAKADFVLTDDEREKVESLLVMLRLDDTFCDYVRRQMNEFVMYCSISQGQLPTLDVPQSFEIRAGEIVHSYADADLIVTKVLKSGPVQDIHRGALLLLDNRAVFQSPTYAQSVNFRNVISLWGDAKQINFQQTGKPVWSFRMHHSDPWLLLIFRKAVQLANQTATRTSDVATSRHIPRQVRQRVWQRYGGQCADCGARDYLEFDHIIPVAKGGSNLDANIQLLCRRCNLKKSDHI
ncbi:HNH endonuclease signature motif containing protein [Novipirellula rosea]|uniref:HNH nuclease domain-containing protein n=1 Tax=Novipirellula rosea TaxID=1031540 RepID=A0ABP8M557_9BACT|tara:strand:- start:8083 stop:9432 length:1350 start_codon:yes stop_codon:yes gene_type:complete